MHLTYFFLLIMKRKLFAEILPCIIPEWIIFLGLYWQCHIYLSDFHISLFYSTDFNNTLRHKFHENMSSGSRIDKTEQDWKVDRHEGSNRRFSRLGERAWKGLRNIYPLSLILNECCQLIFLKNYHSFKKHNIKLE
jgi:hypothetical protein